MTAARRAALADVKVRNDTHAGLWLDKYLEAQTSEGDDDRNDKAKGAKSELLAQVAGRKAPSGYREAFELRLSQAPAPGRVRLVGTATALGRVVVGLGQKGPAEIGITLEHTWGVPILPGSSLKGLAAAAAHLLHGGAEWSKPELDGSQPIARTPNSFDWLFGTTEDRGAVDFLDAWWVPDDGFPLALDVMTPHHAEYYGAPEKADPPPPSDMDSPNPVSFLTSTGKFKVVIEGAPEWVQAAWELLRVGLSELGIGAKTNAGYGRLELARELSREEKEAAELAKRWAGLDSIARELKGIGNATQVFEKFADAAQKGCPEQRLREVAALLVAGAHRKMWKDWVKKDSRKPEEKELFGKYFASFVS